MWLITSSHLNYLHDSHAVILGSAGNLKVFHENFVVGKISVSFINNPITIFFECDKIFGFVSQLEL